MNLNYKCYNANGEQVIEEGKKKDGYFQRLILSQTKHKFITICQFIQIIKLACF